MMEMNGRGRRATKRPMPAYLQAAFEKDTTITKEEDGEGPEMSDIANAQLAAQQQQKQIEQLQEEV